MEQGQKKDNKNPELTTLSVTPPDVVLFCEGKEVGSMLGSTIAQAILDTSSTKYYFTKKNNASATCVYQVGQGLKSTKSSVVFDKKGAYEKTYNGVNWTLMYH